MGKKKTKLKGLNKKAIMVSIFMVIGYILALVGLALSYNAELGVSIAGFCVILLLALPCLLVPIFYSPIKKRRLHRANLKQYEDTSPFKDIDEYNDDKKYKAEYADRVMYINHVYYENYKKNSQVLSDKDMEDLSKRLLYLEEMVRNDDLLTGFQEALILSAFFPFIVKSPEGKEWQPLVVFFIALAVYFVYFFVVRFTDSVNETVKLNEYEIEKIKGLIIDADSPKTDSNWKQKKEAQSSVNTSE